MSFCLSVCSSSWCGLLHKILRIPNPIFSQRTIHFNGSTQINSTKQNSIVKPHLLAALAPHALRALMVEKPEKHTIPHGAHQRQLESIQSRINACRLVGRTMSMSKMPFFASIILSNVNFFYVHFVSVFATQVHKFDFKLVHLSK